MLKEPEKYYVVLAARNPATKENMTCIVNFSASTQKEAVDLAACIVGRENAETVLMKF